MIPEGTFRIDLSSIGAEPLEDEDPRRIGAFPIKAVLGSGGMGRVYLGVAPEGYAAVKRVLPYLSGDRTFLRHFGQELDNQARLPAGVSARLLAADRTARPPWFATEYIPGVTLHEAVHLNGGSLPVDTAWVLLHELAARVASIAALEMVHRDLKPSNVMLTGSGVTLIDFGVARAADQSTVTATGLIVGTPAYMAPEQARATKQPTPAVDVFSLGGVIAFAASGEPPFGAGSGTDLLFRIVHEPPDLAALRTLDAELADVVESCLAKEPTARPSALDLVEIAARHAAPGRPQWPTLLAELIAVRERFAAAATAATEAGDDGATEAGDDGATEAGDDGATEAGDDGATEFEALEALEAPAAEQRSGSEVTAGARVESGAGQLPEPLPEPGIVAAADFAGDIVADGEPAEVSEVAEVAVVAAEVGAAADPEVETMPVVQVPSSAEAVDEPSRSEHSRRRRGLLVIAPLILALATAGALIAMKKVPFITYADGSPKPTVSVSSTDTAGEPNLSESGRAATSPSPSAHASGKASGTASSTANPGSGNQDTTASTGNAGAGKVATTAAESTHTSSSGSGSGGSGSGGDATVVTSSYSEIKNVNVSICVSGKAAVGAQACDGSTTVDFKEVAVSGGFELVNEESGLCLLDDNNVDAYAQSCEFQTTAKTWTVGTRTSRGGQLISSGECLTYSSSTMGNLAMADCDSSDADQLWYAA